MRADDESLRAVLHYGGVPRSWVDCLIRTPEKSFQKKMAVGLVE